MTMKTSLRTTAFAAQALVICCLLAPWDDPFAEYLQRKDGVSLGAGDAKAINSATHIIDPWPRYVGDTRIPADGQRMSGAIERYRDVSKLPNEPKPISPEYQSTTNIPSGAGK